MNCLDKLASKVRLWVPPVLDYAFRPLLGRAVYYTGTYPNWASARAQSSGYDDPSIMCKVLDATRTVKLGKAAFERDSVLFEVPAYPFELLATLLRVAVEFEGHLSVLDFGGSLGSSYYQCRRFLTVLKDIKWGVVEQKHFVDCGRAEFEDGSLLFFESSSACVEAIHPKVVVLSSVLQYLESPINVLNELIRYKCRYLIIDRSPFSDMKRSFLTVQHVPKKIYKASYPSWIFTREDLRTQMATHYELIAEFESHDGWAKAGGIRFSYGGMIFRCRD